MNGKDISFEQLYKEYRDKQFWVYSYDENGNVVPGLAHSPRITKQVTELTEITLDSGSTIRSTSDHPYMLRDGAYAQAKDLKAGDSLMPLYRKVCDKGLVGYEMIYNPGTDSWRFTHTLSVRKVPEGFVRHHKDFNKHNNAPDNIDVILKETHLQLHNISRNNSEQGKKANAAKQKKLAEDAVYRAIYWDKISKSMNRPETIRKIKEKIKKIMNEPERKKFYSDKIKKQIIDGKLDQNKNSRALRLKLENNPSLKEEFLRKIYRPALSEEHKRRISESMRGYQQSCRLNHKVVSVRTVYLESPVPVYDITVEKYHNFALANGVFVHNSGKDLISILTAGRIAYLLLCLADPQGYFGLPAFANIDMVNMAYNANQAKFNFYEPMRKMIERAKCFKHLADCKETHVEFAKNIYAHSGHSDEDSAEGKSLILAVLDEISAFKTKDEFSNLARKHRAPKYSYESLIDAMKSSMQSRFDTGKLIAISYPRYKGCPIQQLYESGLNDIKKNGEKSKVYVSFGATWEINPIKKIEQFEDELRRRPELVKAKYMCRPSQSEDSFIKNDEIIDETFPDVSERQIPHTTGDYPTLKSYVKCKHDFACSIHVDLALNYCRAGFAMTHQYDSLQETIINPDNGQEELIELPLVEIDIITSFQAPPGKEIDFAEIRRFIFSLRNAGYRIGVISYDQWNSASERQTLEKAGFNMVRRSVDSDRSMYDDLKIMMTEKRLAGGYACYRTYSFDGQAVKTCIIKEELRGLVDVRGRKVDHRSGGSKDESDGLAGSIRGAVEFGVWRFGTGLPHNEQNIKHTREMYQDKSELAIINQIKANTGELRTPDNAGFRGNPV
jgi:hypothetical protein